MCVPLDGEMLMVCCGGPIHNPRSGEHHLHGERWQELENMVTVLNLD